MHLKISAILLSVVFLAGMISINTLPAYADHSTCTASLNGSQEVPPIDTEGTGSATMTFDASSNELSWSIEFSGLSGPANAAHFHGPAAAGANAGVQVNIGDVSGLTSPMDGSAVLTPEQASSLLAGQMYINIHTALNTGGEIRGQVSCVESPPDVVWENATLVIGEDEFDIRYNITGGTLDELSGDPDTQTLLVTINATSNGTLTIQLPTNVTNAADDEFSVFIDGESGNFIVDELKPTADGRVLQIEFPAGAEEIEIVGTSMGQDQQPTTKTFSLQIDDQTYAIAYGITGASVTDMSADPDTQTLLVTIDPSSDGVLTIKLPSNVMDAEEEFSVFVDQEVATFDEVETSGGARTLSIDFTQETEEIEIVGTSMVPEFGAISAIILAIALVAVLVAGTKYQKFRGLGPI